MVPRFPGSLTESSAIRSLEKSIDFFFRFFLCTTEINDLLFLRQLSLFISAEDTTYKSFRFL